MNGEGGGGGEEGEISPMFESIGHRPLWGPCPKGGEGENSLHVGRHRSSAHLGRCQKGNCIGLKSSRNEGIYSLAALVREKVG